MKKIFGIFIIALLMQCFGCKEAKVAPQAITPQINDEQVTAEQSIKNDEQKVQMDFGSDELAEALNTLYSEGAYFAFEERPQRIINEASGVDMYPKTNDLGEFGLVAAPLQYDDKDISRGLAVFWLYDGEKNLREGADKSFELAYGEIETERHEPIATFIPEKIMSLDNGLIFEDRYPYSTHEKFVEYKDKHFIIFVWKDRKLDYAFIVR